MNVWSGGADHRIFHARKDLRGNLFALIQDIDVSPARAGESGINAKVGGWTVLDFDNQQPANGSSVLDHLKAAIPKLFQGGLGSVVAMTELAGDILDEADDATSGQLKRVYLGGNVTLGTTAQTGLADLSLSYEAGQGSVVVDPVANKSYASLTTHGSPLSGIALENLFHLPDEPELKIDALIDHDQMHKSILSAKPPTFKAELRLNRGLEVWGDKNFYGESFHFHGLVHFDGDFLFSGGTSHHKSFGLRIARVSLSSKWRAEISGRIGTSGLDRIQFHMDTSWSFSGTTSILFTKWGLSGSAKLSLDADLSTTGFALQNVESDVSGRLKLYYGFGSTTLSSHIGISVGSSGARIELAGTRYRI